MTCIFTYNVTLPQMFLKRFTSKNQLHGLSVNGTSLTDENKFSALLSFLMLFPLFPFFQRFVSFIFIQYLQFMKINNRNTFIYFYLVHSIIKSSLLKIEGYAWNEKIKNFVLLSEETSKFNVQRLGQNSVISSKGNN